MIPVRQNDASRLKPRRIAACLLLSAVPAIPAFAQAQGKTSADPGAASTNAVTANSAKTFEVASIRPGRKFFLKMDGFLSPLNTQAPPKGGLFSWNLPISYLISFAYDLRSAQVSRGAYDELPQWAKDTWYTVEARADGDPSRDDVRQMVRALLEDRFKLAVHSGTRDGQVNALTLVKPVAGLKLHAEGAPCDLTPPPAVSAYPPYQQVPIHCGIFDRELSRYNRRLEMMNVTMAQIADTLSSHSPLPVVDSTGLAGRYDAFLEYGPEILPPGTDPGDEVGSPVSIGLPKQLGLKLVKQNATVPYFDIDHIEPPSEN